MSAIGGAALLRWGDRPQPNPHVGFGGGGTHFCLGNQLAKLLLRALFAQILTRVPDIHVTAEPELLGTNFIRGVKRQQVAFAPER